MAHGTADWWSRTRALMELDFTDLTDTPGSYAGKDGKVIQVTALEDGLEFSDTVIDDHHARHENGGDDEIDIDGLEGTSADLATHAGLPAVHHARYTDAEARVNFSPISVPPAAFISNTDGQDYVNATTMLQNRTSLNSQVFVAPVYFPHGVTVVRLTLYGYSDDATAILQIALYRIHRLGGLVEMALVRADWTTGWSNLADESISYALIDNSLYSYSLALSIDPYDSVDNVRFSAAKIDFTG